MRVVIAAFSTVFLASATLAEGPSYLPPGFCMVDPAQGGYRETLWKRLSPPPNRGVSIELMAVDCDSLKAADKGRPDRPKKLFTNLRSNSNDDLPKDRDQFLSTLETRYAGPTYMGRDEYAVYVAQQPSANGGTEVSGASAFTIIDGAPRILNIIGFNAGNVSAEAKSALVDAVKALHSN